MISKLTSSKSFWFIFYLPSEGQTTEESIVEFNDHDDDDDDDNHNDNDGHNNESKDNDGHNNEYKDNEGQNDDASSESSIYIRFWV